MSKKPSPLAMWRQIAEAAGTIPNTWTDENGFKLSYNPYCHDTQTDETAIVIDGGYFLILDGDHRAQLSGKSRSEALAYWSSLPHLHGGTSNTLSDLPQ